MALKRTEEGIVLKESDNQLSKCKGKKRMIKLLETNFYGMPYDYELIMVILFLFNILLNGILKMKICLIKHKFIFLK